LNLRLSILKAALPISKWIAKRHSPFSRKLITEEHVEDFKKIYCPGLVLISSTYGELANWFIPGQFSHAAILGSSYIKSDIIEARTTGVCYTKLYNFFMTKDRVVALRPLFCDLAGMKIAAIDAENAIGMPYDYYFSPSNDAFYCSELIGYAYSRFGVWTKRMTMGIETIVPDDFYLSAKSKQPKWEIVWDSALAK
jgi:uncharacterized protein YycO